MDGKRTGLRLSDVATWMLHRNDTYFLKRAGKEIFNQIFLFLLLLFLVVCQRRLVLYLRLSFQNTLETSGIHCIFLDIQTYRTHASL